MPYNIFQIKREASFATIKWLKRRSMIVEDLRPFALNIASRLFVEVVRTETTRSLAFDLHIRFHSYQIIPNMETWPFSVHVVDDTLGRLKKKGNHRHLLIASPVLIWHRWIEVLILYFHLFKFVAIMNKESSLWYVCCALCARSNPHRRTSTPFNERILYSYDSSQKQVCFS